MKPLLVIAFGISLLLASTTESAATASDRPNLRADRCVQVSCKRLHDGSRRCRWRCPARARPAGASCRLVGCRRTESGRRCRWRCFHQPVDQALRPPARCRAGSYSVGNGYCCPIGTVADGTHCRKPRPRQRKAPTNIDIFSLGLNRLLEASSDAWGIVGVILFVFALAFVMDKHAKATRHRHDEVPQLTRSAQDLGKRMAALSREADDFIATVKKRAYERGRSG